MPQVPILRMLPLPVSSDRHNALHPVPLPQHRERIPLWLPSPRERSLLIRGQYPQYESHPSNHPDSPFRQSAHLSRQGWSVKRGSARTRSSSSSSAAFRAIRSPAISSASFRDISFPMPSHGESESPSRESMNGYVRHIQGRDEYAVQRTPSRKMHPSLVRFRHHSKVMLPPPKVWTFSVYGDVKSAALCPVALASSSISEGNTMTRLASPSVSLQQTPQRVQENPIFLIFSASSSRSMVFTIPWLSGQNSRTHIFRFQYGSLQGATGARRYGDPESRWPHLHRQKILQA